MGRGHAARPGSARRQLPGCRRVGASCTQSMVPPAALKHWGHRTVPYCQPLWSNQQAAARPHRPTARGCAPPSAACTPRCAGPAPPTAHTALWPAHRRAGSACQRAPAQGQSLRTRGGDRQATDGYDQRNLPPCAVPLSIGALLPSQVHCLLAAGYLYAALCSARPQPAGALAPAPSGLPEAMEIRTTFCGAVTPPGRSQSFTTMWCSSRSSRPAGGRG